MSAQRAKALTSGGFAAIRRLRAVKDGSLQMTLAEFKALIREQFLMLLMDQEATLQAIPDLLPADEDARRKGLAALREVLSARGELSGEATDRWQRIIGLFGIDPGLSCGRTGSEIDQANRIGEGILTTKGRGSPQASVSEDKLWSRLTQTKPKLLTKNTST